MKLHMTPNTPADLAAVLPALPRLPTPAGIGRNATHSAH